MLHAACFSAEANKLKTKFLLVGLGRTVSRVGSMVDIRCQPLLLALCEPYVRIAMTVVLRLELSG